MLGAPEPECSRLFNLTDEIVPTSVVLTEVFTTNVGETLFDLFQMPLFH